METNFVNSSHSAALRATLTWTPKSLPVLRRILTDELDILTRKDAQGNTILHFLAAGGNATAFRELFEGGLLTRSNGGGGGELRTWNWRGDTVLHEAARFGRVNVVEIIMERERELVLERNAMGGTPLYSAAANGEREVFNLLKVAAADEELLRRDDSCTILHAAILGEHYSLAMEIVESFPNLAGAHDKNGNTALNMLASKPVSFKSGSSYWLRNLGSRPFIPLQFLLCLVYLLVPWLKGVREVKKKHACALDLAKRLIAKEEDWSHYTNSCGRYNDYDDNDRPKPIITKTRRNPLLQAAENSIQELVEEILGKFPEAAFCVDSNGKNIFHIAVEKKDERMYWFLKKNVARKEGMMAALDHSRNSILHFATKPGANPRVLLGNLNQMAWDVYWFKLVYYDSPPHLPWYPNSDGKTATELFEDTHSGLRKDAEEALKSMNGSLLLVSALIGTVNYAAVFTLPGGFDSNRDSRDPGRPALCGTGKERDLLLFLWFTGVALYAAFLSLVEMVVIQLSKFASSDFFTALPFRYIVAITALYVSVLFTILACFEAYYIIDLRINVYVFLGPALAVATIVFIDSAYLILCRLCLALCCSLSHRGHMFEAVIVKHSIEEAKLYETTSR
ncbi:hypothetical protein RHGRI_015196 [Rhododendron griersonianum]|uniref:PGG domain-containing protein n=1 Tax=Rhododendron griersonianum TaxID=479676 RepID=A0AAV6KCZ6_9ERIC|nr:hypothetical protein RHGRI_015196 [Rhododendron griersonianum]